MTGWHAMVLFGFASLVAAITVVCGFSGPRGWKVLASFTTAVVIGLLLLWVFITSEAREIGPDIPAIAMYFTLSTGVPAAIAVIGRSRSKERGFATGLRRWSPYVVTIAVWAVMSAVLGWIVGCYLDPGCY